jgi:RNA polymerase sigma-70 factor, ECF subfamily
VLRRRITALVVGTEEVWTALRADLGAFFRKRARDEHVAEDLLQETFVRVHDGLASLDREDRLVPWVFRVARNVLADHARRARPAEALEHEPAADEEADGGDLNREVSGWLREMLPLLPDEQRAAVELAELEGLTQEEVARRLGLSLSGAKSRVQRGRRRLRALLLACCHVDFDRRGNVVGYTRRGACEGCSEG